MRDYTYDPSWDQWYMGDPSIESNWTHDPPGQQANPDYWNLEPDGNGGWTGYSPGEPAPEDATQFSTPEWDGEPPTPDEQDNAVLDHAAGLGLLELGPPPTYERPEYPPPKPIEEPPPVTTAAPTTVAEARAAYLRTTEVTSALEEKIQAAYDAGDMAKVTELTRLWTIARGKEARAKSAMERFEADLLAENLVTSNRAAREEAARLAAEKEEGLRIRAELAEAGANERARIQAETARRTAGAGQAEQIAQRQAELAQRQIEHAATQTDREKSQRQALAHTLLGMSTGPNGPANRRMALELLAGLGVNTGGGGTTGGATPPNLIPPAIWDAMAPGAQRILMDAWVAQGGDPKDFLFSIDAQRPQGRPSAPARVRYAAPVGA